MLVEAEPSCFSEGVLLAASRGQLGGIGDAKCHFWAATAGLSPADRLCPTICGLCSRDPPLSLVLKLPQEFLQVHLQHFNTVSVFLTRPDSVPLACNKVL